MFKKLLITGLSFLSFAFAAVDINTADKNVLMTLSDIGEVKAQAIIDYREANGPFKSVEELKNVKGIGKATIEKLRSDVTINSGETVSEEEKSDKTAVEKSTKKKSKKSSDEASDESSKEEKSSEDEAEKPSKIEKLKEKAEKKVKKAKEDAEESLEKIEDKAKEKLSGLEK